MTGLLDGVRILLLEDEFLIAMDVEQTCRDFGAQSVFIARSVEEAEVTAATLEFDAAIVDIMLGGTSTLPFARGLAKKGLPFVFASGYADLQEIDGQFPGVTVIGKPYAGNDLVDALSVAIARVTEPN